MVRWKINQTVIKILPELKARENWHQMTLLIILQHYQKSSTLRQKPK